MDFSRSRRWFIYKITNPSGRVYIGRTCAYKRRIEQYRYLNCKNQPLLYRSLVKYGFDDHIIQIIEIIRSDLSYINGKEIFWIKTYMSNGAKYPETGLNSCGGGGGTYCRKVSSETIDKIKEAKRKNPHRWSNDRKRQFIEIMTGKPRANKGYKMPDHVIKILRDANIFNNKKAKKIIQMDMDGNHIAEFISRGQASRELKLNTGSILRVVSGKRNHVGGFRFKYKNSI